jgi:type IV pilus assembly protein PilV
MRVERLGAVRSRQSGVGLIEVLIALLVLSVGFLGIAALEAVSLSTNNSAYARSLATINSYSILDAMRADIANAKAGSYNTSSALAANACPAAGTTLAGVQLNQWCTALGSTLGATATTTGNVSCDSNGICTITITFNDSRSGTKLGCSTSGSSQNCSAQAFSTKGVL